MATLYVLMVHVCLIGSILAQFQFPNPFSMMASTGTGSFGNSTDCSQTISCAPWCSRTLDANRCVVCQCNTGGMNPMGGVNPMSLMGPMSGGANPLSAMFPGLTGGMSPMNGGVQKQGPACAPAPTTCAVPQPWCERITDTNQCVKCLCGNELVAYIQTLNGQTIPTTAKPIVTDTPTTTFQPITTTLSSTHAHTTTNKIRSCMDDFFCTKLCDNGYKTDGVGCPLCECLTGTLVDTPVNATDPPGKFTRTTPESAGSHALIVTDPVTSCPGIFDCPIICNNGYKTDPQGCPLCACENA